MSRQTTTKILLRRSLARWGTKDGYSPEGSAQALEPLSYLIFDFP